MKKTYYVTGSLWIDGSGISYTEDLDPIVQNEKEQELFKDKSLAIDYADEFKKGLNLQDNEDYLISVYTKNPDGELILKDSCWVKEPEQ